MDGLMDVFGKLTFALLAVWVVLAGMGQTTMPGEKKQQLQHANRRRGRGAIWAVPVVSAPNASEGRGVL